MYTAWSDDVTIMSVLLFFTVRIEFAVGSEKKHYFTVKKWMGIKEIKVTAPVELMRQ